MKRVKPSYLPPSQEGRGSVLDIQTGTIMIPSKDNLERQRREDKGQQQTTTILHQFLQRLVADRDWKQGTISSHNAAKKM